MMVHAFIPSTGKAKADVRVICEFEATLVYIVISRIPGVHSETLFVNKQQTNKIEPLTMKFDHCLLKGYFIEFLS